MANNIIDSIQLSGTTYQIQGSGGGVPESVFTAYTASTDSRIGEDEEVTAAALNALDEKIDSISGGGNPTVEVTQAEYDAMVTAGTVSADTYYIITDAQAVDLTNYYTKSQTNTLLNGKQATLVSGTNIKTINNESLLGSGNIDIQGGSTYTAGRGISIANDTISFNLPIFAGTGDGSIQEGNSSANVMYSHAEGWGTQTNGYYSHSEGQLTEANGIYSHAEGYQAKATGSGAHAEGRYTIATGVYSHAEGDNTAAGGDYSFAGGRYSSANTIYSFAHGRYINANNESEHSIGKFNVSNTGSTDANKTLFSVGNGTSASKRHNAFEIKQNGDIYLSLNGQDVKLQDQLVGSSITVDTALDSGSTNPVENRVIYNKIDEVEQVTAAGLNAVNDKFGGLKLQHITQSDYNNLQTKDPSTLYIIVN